jgi:Carbohydrate-binding module 48 (Isoamylase N-terminal domain)
MDHDDDRELSRRVAASYPSVGSSDEEAKARIMDRVRRERRERRIEMGRGPSIGFAIAASLALGTLLGWVLHERLGASSSAGSSGRVAAVSSTREVRMVQFVLRAPKASHVTVVGDFNEWDPAATPMARGQGGAWTAAIPVAPGRHVYAFIVDGDRWVSDPAAPLAPEDGFGIRNSVIVVGGQEST